MVDENLRRGNDLMAAQFVFFSLPHYFPRNFTRNVKICNNFPWSLPLMIVTIVMTSKRFKLCRFTWVLDDVCNHVNFKALFNNFNTPISSHCSNRSDITKWLLQMKRNLSSSHCWSVDIISRARLSFFQMPGLPVVCCVGCCCTAMFICLCNIAAACWVFCVIPLTPLLPWYSATYHQNNGLKFTNQLTFYEHN